MEDIQNSSDKRNLPIDQVGVRDLRYPIVVLDRANEKQETIAELSLSVNLPHHFKGTHMSRFIEVLNRHRGEVTMRTIPTILRELKERLEAESAQIEVKFPYFMERVAPVTKAKSLMDYECTYRGEVNGKKDDYVLGVTVPVTCLCPCSKAISDYGAHNQRGYVTVEVRFARTRKGAPAKVWIEEIVELVEGSASSPLYPLLKRPDERYVTMQAYDNPVFVEDLVRNVAESLREDKRVTWFSVQAINHESIHTHNAFARIEWSRVQAPHNGANGQAGKDDIAEESFSVK